jgi:regulator of protease activity HflC (stomatin/prohibitin superfamily)
MKKFFVTSIVAAMALLSGCTRIATGEVGLREDMSRNIQATELQPGSWNQTMFGNVLLFPVKDIAVNLENKHPLTADNTALADFDMTVVYNINPSGVSELYTKKSRAFHAVDGHGETLLMYNYINTLVNNASYKAVREWPALAIADNRDKIEAKIKEHVAAELKAEGLESNIHLTVVQVKSALPSQEILRAATAVVNAQNELKVKTTEVQIAQKESERMAALASQGAQSIAYMQAKAQLNISEGIMNGRVHTVVVPTDFRGMVNVGK